MDVKFEEWGGIVLVKQQCTFQCRFATMVHATPKAMELFSDAQEKAATHDDAVVLCDSITQQLATYIPQLPSILGQSRKGFCNDISDDF